MSSAVWYLALLVAGGAATLVPTPWIAFPAAFVLVVWLPGKLLVRAHRGLGDGRGRHWLGPAAAVVLMPVALSWVWRFTNVRLAVLGAVMAVNVVLWLLALRAGSVARPAPLWDSRRARVLFGLLLAFVGVCVFCTVWLPGAGQRFGVVAAGDYAKHHAVLWSLERFPLPLHSVFYAGEPDTPYYYYQYHHHLPAALRTLAGNQVSIGGAFGLTCALVAVVFIAAVAVLARETSFLGTDNRALLAAACVSVVGGWDVVPALLRLVSGQRPGIVLDAWCPIPWRLHNLATQFQWCPQHVVATLAVVLAAVGLRRCPSARAWLVLAPLLAAAVFGSSVYLAMTVFAAAGVYVAHRMWSARRASTVDRRLPGAVLVIVVLGLLLMARQAWEYRAAGARIGGGLTLEWPRFDFAVLGRLAAPGPLANLLDAPGLLLVDLGLPFVAFFLLAGAAWRNLWRDEGLRLLLLAGLVGTGAFLVARSSHSPFDYSFRIAVMPLQVLGAICAAALLVPDNLRTGVRRWRRPVLAVGILLGLPAGLYETPLMAVRSLLLPNPQAPEVGALHFLRTQTPPDAVVQRGPQDALTLPELTDRQLGVADPDDSHVRVFYPHDIDRMRRVYADVGRAFESAASPDAWSLLRAASVDYVLLGTQERARYPALHQFDDPAWFELVYADAQARVYRLRSPAPQTTTARSTAP